jgi:hypothetical protein
MKLYVIRVSGRVDYDEYDSMVIFAESEEQARKIANEKVCSGQTNVFLDPTYATCEELKDATEPGVVVASYNAS